MLRDVFAMESELGESSGAMELFCELQSESFDETQANTFRNNPSVMDEDMLKQIPETLERMRQVMAKTKGLCESRRATLDELEASIVELCEDLGADRNAYRNASVFQHPPLSLRIIEAVGAMQTQARALRERRGAIIHELANSLRKVWDQLQIPANYRDSFAVQHKGRSMEVIKACQAELEKAESLKAYRIRELILQLRDRIRAAWDALSATHMERKMFEDRYNYDTDATFTDEALTAHKILAKTLEEKVLILEPIIAKIKEHSALLEEKATYDELTKNGDRLRDRKYNMKHEESLRKRVSKLPHLSDVLISELAKWKAQNNSQPFIYAGIDYLQELLAERSRADEEKAQRQLRRGISATPSSKQPHSSTTTSSSSITSTQSSTLPAMTPSRKPKTSQSSSSLSTASSSALPALTPSRNPKPSSQASTSAEASSVPPVTPARNSSSRSTPPIAAAATEEQHVSSRSRANTTDGTKGAPSSTSSRAPENQEPVNC